MLETLIVNWPYVGGSAGAYLIRPKSFAPFVELYRISLPFDVSHRRRGGDRLGLRSSARRMGAGLAAIRDDEVAAAALGVPTLRLKVDGGGDQRRDPRHGRRAAAVLQFLSSIPRPPSASAIPSMPSAMSLVGGARELARAGRRRGGSGPVAAIRFGLHLVFREFGDRWPRVHGVRHVRAARARRPVPSAGGGGGG